MHVDWIINPDAELRKERTLSLFIMANQMTDQLPRAIVRGTFLALLYLSLMRIDLVH